MPPFRWSLRVRYQECDPQGIVFNAHYFAYFDMTMTELLREAFGSYQQLLDDQGVDLVVAEATARFLASARFDDVLELQAQITRLGVTGMTVAYAAIREGERLVTGELRYVFVDTASWSKTPIPDGVRSAFGRYVAAEDAGA